MTKKRILVDTFYLYVAQTGIRTYIRTFCGQAESQVLEDVTYIFTPDWKKAEKNMFFKGKTSKWKNWLFQGIYFFRKLIILPVLSYWHRADVVFSPDILSPIWSRGTKVSVIHDAFFWENPTHYNSKWLRIFIFFLYRGLKRNTTVVTISNYSKRQLRKYLPFPALPIIVVYPATHFKASEIAPISSPPVAGPYFLHVGVMEKRKNLPLLAKALAILVQKPQFTTYKLVLLGQRGPREELDDYDEIMTAISDLGIEAHVVFPGYVDESTMAGYYQHAVAYLFPSLSEGFGMPILEAFSYRLPVIVSNQGALVEIGGNAVLEVEDTTPEGFANAMEVIATNPNYREELVQNGLERLKKFSEVNFLQSLHACFVRDIEKNPR
ncbi:glycosyltransferase family 4 protein [Lunatibacter salilacus]|uniref:glycosyltransferase family 4 protein n=1 Tax=Lunatibacter salilacus TaxID=2483804 RepID=UPI00131B475A|nr:glycosyltransferase family 1 protein [Lunatibacter salilacus]